MTEMINGFIESHPPEIQSALVAMMQVSNPMLAGSDQ